MCENYGQIIGLKNKERKLNIINKSLKERELELREIVKVLIKGTELSPGQKEFLVENGVI